MLRKIDKLILRSFTGPFLAAFSIILFILVLQFLSKYIDDIFGKGLESDVLARVFLYACLSLVTLALPLGVLLASLMTMGNMGEHYELAALKSSGVSLFKTMRPLMAVTVLITLFSAWFSFYVVPEVNLKFYTLLYDLSKVKPSFAIKPKHFYTDIDGYVIHVADIDRERDMLHKIKIYDHSKDIGNLRIIVADSGKMLPNENAGYLMIYLYNGVSHEDVPKELGKEKNYQYQRYYFEKLDYRVNLTGFEMEESDPSTFAPHHYMKNIVQLYTARDSLSHVVDSIGKDFGKYASKYIKLDSALISPEFLERKREKERNRLKEQQKFEQSQEAKPSKADAKKEQEEAKVVVPGAKNNPLVKNLPTGQPVVAAADSNYLKIHPPAREFYDVKMDQPVIGWFKMNEQVDVMNKALHGARAIKNYAVVTNDRVRSESLKRRKFSIEFNYRIVLPVSCLVFLFLGAPLGAIIRKGGVGMPILFSIIFFIVFYILMMWGRKFARDEILPVFWGVWLPCLVMFPFALYFSFKASRDAPVFNMQVWYKIFSSLKKVLFTWWWPFKKEKEQEVSFWDNPRFGLSEAEIETLPPEIQAKILRASERESEPDSNEETPGWDSGEK